MRRPLANLCTALLIAVIPAAGAAAQARVEVPDGCGSERELYEGLEELVGQDASAALPAQLRISAPDADGMHTLSLQIQGESRVLEDRDCRALWKSAIVMCAVRVRPDLTVATGTTAPAPAVVPSAANDRAESTPWSASVGIGGGAALGLGPALAPVLELNASLESGRFGAALALRAVAATEARADDARGARVHAFGARLAALATPWPIARFQAGVELYRLNGEGFGSDATLSDGAWTVAPVLEAALRPLRLSHLWLEVGVAGSLNVVRPRFDILGYGTVYRVPQFGGSAVLRLGWAFR